MLNKYNRYNRLFFPPYYYLTSVIPPASFSEGPATYIVVANGCYEWGQYVTIYVQPTIEFRASLGLSYALKADIKEMSIKERRDERIKSRLAMEDTKPKMVINYVMAGHMQQINSS